MGYSDGVDTLYSTLDMMKKNGVTIKFENIPQVIFSCSAVDAADKAIEFLNLYRNQGGVPDETIYNTVIKALGNCGLWKSFLNVLAVMKTPLPLPRILKKQTTTGTTAATATLTSQNSQNVDKNISESNEIKAL